MGVGLTFRVFLSEFLYRFKKEILYLDKKIFVQFDLRMCDSILVYSPSYSKIWKGKHQEHSPMIISYNVLKKH